MAFLCTFPTTTALITSQKPPILFPTHSRPFPLPPLNYKSHRPNFPTLSAAPPRRAVSTPDAAVLENLDGLPDRWREIMGNNDWKGLLDPLDPLLRLLILRYGDLTACTYDAFIDDVYARNYGVAKFDKFNFFDQKEMPKHGYDVTQYIYATSNKKWWPPFLPKPINPRTWQENNIWIGFIAVSDDATSKKLGRREICIAWRGTITKIEWENDALINLVHLPDDMPGPKSDVKVENGFLTLYTHKDGVDFSARRLVLEEVKRLVNEVYPNEELSITVMGHSLGGALAVLNAYDLVESGANGKAPVCAITFAGPKVGNSEFKDRVEELGVKVLRIVNADDVVPQVPLGKEIFGFHIGYFHVGVEMELEGKDSPYLKPPPNDVATRKSMAHDLELYMHLVDGYQGKGKKFELATGRDLALLNKYHDALTDDQFVTPSWRGERNKSMVKYEGRWVHESTVNYFL